MRVTTTARVIGGGPTPGGPRRAARLEVDARPVRRAQPRDRRLQRRLHRVDRRGRRPGRRLHRQRGQRRALLLATLARPPLLRRSPRGAARSHPHRGQALRRHDFANRRRRDPPRRRRDRRRRSSPSTSGSSPPRTPAHASGPRSRERPASFRSRGRGDFEHLSSVTRLHARERRAGHARPTSPRARTPQASPRGLPGGDPSLLVMPPVEQFRRVYVFLTPGQVQLRLRAHRRSAGRRDPVRRSRRPGALRMHSSRSSFPSAVRAPRPSSSTAASSPSRRSIRARPPSVSRRASRTTGFTRSIATRKVGVLVDGFDRNVSYAYAAGTELTEIVPR